jgi:hypothetical protein
MPPEAFPQELPAEAARWALRSCSSTTDLGRLTADPHVVCNGCGGHPRRPRSDFGLQVHLRANCCCAWPCDLDSEARASERKQA